MLYLNEKKRFFQWAVGGSIILNIFLWIICWAVFPKYDSQAVLHYSVDVGIDFIGQGKQILLLPLIGLMVIVGNVVLGVLLRKTDARSAWIFWGVLPLIQVVLIGAFILIWRANI